MKKGIILYMCLFCSVAMATSQTLRDTTQVISPDTLVSDTVDNVIWQQIQPVELDTVETMVVDTLKVEEKYSYANFKPDPTRAVWMGALIPGFGQIVNKKYWKLPIVYGGFMGFAYALNWNNNRYISYKNAYRDIIDDDPTTNYHIEILPRGYTLENYPGGISVYIDRLKTGMDQFRRYRDMTILLTIGYYALVILDAYVDAQLYDFDISPDLVLNVAPARIEYNEHSSKSAFGLHWSLRF